MDPEAAAAPAEPPKERPLGPDGKPIPGLAEINAIKAERKINKQEEQLIVYILMVELLIMTEHFLQLYSDSL